MQLRYVFVHTTGAYLLAQDEATNRSAGAFCWSGEQIFRVLKSWNISMGELTLITKDLSKPENALVPKTHVRQPILVEGIIAALIAKQFSNIDTLKQVGIDKPLATLPDLPTGQIIACMIDDSEKKPQFAILFYADPTGTPNMVILRNQLHGLAVLSYSWIMEEQKSACQRSLGKLPMMGDDDLDFPTLIQGDIVHLLIVGILLHQKMTATSELS